MREAFFPRLLFGAAFVAVAALAGACSGDPEGDSPTRLPERSSGEDAGADAAPAPPAGGPSCTNGTRDGDETDVDCGGELCPPCANGSACALPRDCVSLVCTGGSCNNHVGCSDGSREAFASLGMFPDIAACSGGWSIAGLVTTTTAACGHASGNGSENPTGKGCNVADLCQAGWHVCETAAEVGQKSGGGCAGAVVAGQNAFFVVRQSGTGNAQCGAGTNDLFGCGDVGLAPDPATCAPLDRFSNDLCAALPATWACGTDGADEANKVTKTASEGGGVLCCRD